MKCPVKNIVVNAVATIGAAVGAAMTEVVAGEAVAGRDMTSREVAGMQNPLLLILKFAI